MNARALRSAVGAALVCAAVPSLAATAVTKSFVLTDQRGDGNGLHDQGTGTFGSGTATPVSDPGKDVLSLTMAPLPGKRCTGYTAVVELAGAPTANTVYRVTGKTRRNGHQLVLRYANNFTDGTTTELRYDSGIVPLSTPAKVTGSRITFRVLEKDLKAAGEELAAVRIEAPGLDVRSALGVGGLTVPSWDVLVNDDKGFKVCS